MSSSTLTGLKASYLYSTSTARTKKKPDRVRVDVPGSMFRDGRARTATYASSRATSPSAVSAADAGSEGEIVIYYTGTNQVDAEVTEVLSDAGAILDLVSPVAPASSSPFSRMTPQEFKATAQAEGFQIVVANEATTTVTQTIPLDGATWQQTLTYETETGAVTQVESVVESASLTERSSTNIKYVAVPQIAGMTVPYEITSAVSTTGRAAQPFGGLIRSTNVVRFNNIKVNSLSDAYFSGGN